MNAGCAHAEPGGEHGLLPRTFQSLEIGDVLLSSSGALVRKQRIATDDGDLPTLQLERISTSYGFVERDAVGSIQDMIRRGGRPICSTPS